MSDLRIERVHGDPSGNNPAGPATALADWRHVHNLVIPTHELSPADVLERSGRHVLHVAYLGDTLVGCSTVRPPAPDSAPATATVIARILPAHRGHGFGRELYAYALAQARELGSVVIETVVLASNPEGLRFAEKNGFVEFDRYVLPGDTVPYVDLRLTPA